MLIPALLLLVATAAASVAAAPHVAGYQSSSSSSSSSKGAVFSKPLHRESIFKKNGELNNVLVTFLAGTGIFGSSPSDTLVRESMRAITHFNVKMKLEEMLQQQNTATSSSSGSSLFYWPYAKFGIPVDSTYRESIVRLLLSMSSAAEISASVDSNGKPRIAEDPEHNTPLSDFMESQFYVTAEYGTPGQQVKSLLDTGSSDAWTISSSCHDPKCYLHKRFDYEKSETYTAIDKPFEISYVSGKVSGFQGSDNIDLASMPIQNITMGQADSLSMGMVGFIPDGIIGLGLPAISTLQAAPLQVIKDQKILKNNIVSFYLNPENKDGFFHTHGMVIFGGIDNTYASGDFHYHNLTTDLFWTIPLTKILVGDKDVLQDYKKTSSAYGSSAQNSGESKDEEKKKFVGIIDTGTSLIGMGVSLANAINEILGAKVGDRGVATIDCKLVDSLPTVTFVFDDQHYPLLPRQYVFKAMSMCISPFLGIEALDNDLPRLKGQAVIVGDVFLRTYYTAFDYDNRSVGFAPSKSTQN